MLAAGDWQFRQFHLICFRAHFDQGELWELFSRVLQVSDVPCWEGLVYDELRRLSGDVRISKPRNAYLYAATHWPLGDLLEDVTGETFSNLHGTLLDVAEQGFLLRLSYDVYRLFETLVEDLANESGPIRSELEASRIARDRQSSDLVGYNAFLATLANHT